MTSVTRMTLGTFGAAIAAVALGGWPLRGDRPIGELRLAAQQAAASPAGQTVTRLADGRWLVAGGQGAERTATVWDPRTATSIPTAPPEIPRAFHSATLLPDGTVLVVGGRNESGLAEIAERFDPDTRTFTLVPFSGAVSRFAHTATLLTDGRVLIVGGERGGPAALDTEIWDVNARTATTVPSAAVARRGHRAALMPDGRVLVTGGMDLDGTVVSDPLALDPLIGRLSRASENAAQMAAQVTASDPAPGDADVALDAHVTLRWSLPLNADSLTTKTLALTGPRGPIAVRIVPAEDGRLVFIWPIDRLDEETSYALTVSGVVDRRGVPVLPISIPFATRRVIDGGSGADAEDWTPDPATGWRTGRGGSPWQTLQPLEAPPGVTAVAGQVLRLNGEPLAGVRLEVGSHLAHTDRTGRFLMRLDGTLSGHIELWVDGRTANRPRATYGSYEIGVDLKGGHTNALPYTIWMTKLDTAHAVTIPSPTVAETIVTTPLIPGLELHVQPNTVIRDRDGKTVKTVSITPIPLDRPPFPLPADVHVPVYFTIQPGGAYVYVSGNAGRRGARLVYPNGFHLPPATVFEFWHYNPDGAGWAVYGRGQVTPNGQQVAPNPGVEIYEFTGAMAAPPGFAPSTAPPPNGKKGGDPVDLYTGLFVMEKTDLIVADVVPVALTRTYRPADTRSRAFGIGATHPYDQFLVGDTFPYTYLDLVLPDGGRVHYDRTSSGTGYADAVYQHVQTPTGWYQSTIAWNGAGWTLTRTDGTVMKYRDGFTATRPQQGALTEIRDRFGNVLTLTRDTDANLTRIQTPNGRFLAFTYDGSYRVTQVQDQTGRTVGYTYNGNGELWKVTDPASGVTEYAYDGSHRMTSITDARGITYLMNTYDGSDRVIQQDLPDGTYQFAYSVDGSGRKVTDVTNPRGYVTRDTFNGAGYGISRVEAVGTAVERTMTTTRETGTNFPTAVVDGLGRQTAFTYDGHGHMATLTRLAGTANATTISFAYEPQFFQLATVTDPLSHTWTVTYDASARLNGMTDPLSHHAVIGLNSAGQVTSVADPLSHQWQFTYTQGDFTATTDPLNHTTTRFVDSAGRAVAVTDPLGRMTRTTYDALNRGTTVTDPLGGQTVFSYDANSNLTALTDALTHTTSYAYDDSDRVETRTDPLSHAASYAYDGNDNLTQTTDRRGQITSRTYDALDRLAVITFDDSSTVTYTYDAGDRVVDIDDSANGTITRTYDDLDRLTEETTAEGTVDYTYYADGNRATMTVAGQTGVDYVYDDAHRLTSIAQGTDVVALTYDDANRRSTLTHSNGIVATYGYDVANQLTSLAYTSGATTLGNLTYTYDAAGQRTSVGGSWARTGLPTALTSATYDAANRIVSWDATSFSYDLNGNLTSDGTNTYSWNARDQLSGISGSASGSFLYDGLRRRRSKTISGTTTRFLYDRLNFVQELSSGGSPIANILTGLSVDETFVRTDAAGYRALLVDALGSALELADNSSTLQTHYTYEPFGGTSESGVLSGNTAEFSKRENDGGLYYYRSRFYLPRLQRFASEDRLGLVGGDVNLFAFVRNDPVRWIDPFGLKIWNFTENTIWVKPEHNDVPEPVEPGDYYEKDIDGFADPVHSPGEVYKSVNGVDVMVYPDGSVKIPDFLDKVKQVLGDGGWKDGKWERDRENQGDPCWRPLWEKSNGRKDSPPHNPNCK